MNQPSLVYVASHTPGKWHCEEQIASQYYTGIGEPVCVVGGEATGEPVEFVIGRSCDYGPHGAVQTEANARLIAACPEMYSLIASMAIGSREPHAWKAEACRLKAEIEQASLDWIESRNNKK